MAETNDPLYQTVRDVLGRKLGNMNMTEAAASALWDEVAQEITSSVRDNVELSADETATAVKQLIEATGLQELDPQDLAEAPDDADIDFPAQGSALGMIREPIKVYRRLVGTNTPEPEDDPATPGPNT